MRCEEARAQYLEGDVSDAAREHLATCPHCIAHRPALETMERVLNDPLSWTEPPPELEQRVMQLIDASGDEELPAPGRRRRWPVVGAAAAVLAVVVATGAILFSRQPAPDWEITAAGVGPAESAVVVIAGWNEDAGTRVALRAEGLAPAPDGHTYELWLIGPGPVSGGTFAAATEQVDLFVGVTRIDYPTVAVTLEPLDGDPAPSGIFVFGPGP